MIARKERVILATIGFALIALYGVAHQHTNPTRKPEALARMTTDPSSIVIPETIRRTNVVFITSAEYKNGLTTFPPGYNPNKELKVFIPN